MDNLQTIKPMQLSLFDSSEIKRLSSNMNNRECGAIFTRPEVVNFILDLIGYTIEEPLNKYRILEPSFGEGDFLFSVVERLLSSYVQFVPNKLNIVDDLSDSIRAVEINAESINRTRIRLLTLLLSHNVPESDANKLINSWIIEGDFLLVDIPFAFTHVVGNPPYVRQELIPDILIAEYRLRFNTIYDRADLYIPFIERCLSTLEQNGLLGFICSNRWLKNKYGAPLRAMISKQFHLKYYIDMVDTPAFRSDVIAYPAITIFQRGKPGVTRIAHQPEIDSETLSGLVQTMKAETLSESCNIEEVCGVVKNHEPWILRSFNKFSVVQRLEEEYPKIEDAGCKVGIGVATGLDKVFIGPFESLDVEQDRKLPLVKTDDIKAGFVSWRGLGVINPFSDDGSLINLDEWPRLSGYFKKNEDEIRNRNCAKKNPKGWYRTIDRIYPELTYKSKLLIPDIKEDAHIIYEDGNFYPHHNLYYILSDEWDLKVLCAVLRSGIAKLFVSTYSTQMRGGYFRFQAQYLRKIRIPLWTDIPKTIRPTLIEAANSGNVKECMDATFDLYKLSKKERIAILDNRK